MEYDFYTTDVFTDQKFGGNPLAVFPHAAGLSDHQMQQIAREFNLSETIFIVDSDLTATKPIFKVRIFTPNHELPFAGHPTVGGAFVLATIGIIQPAGPVTEIIFDELIGPVPIKIFSDESGTVTGAQLSAAVMPHVVPGAPSADELAPLFGLQPGDVLSNAFSPEIVTAGTPRLFVPVKHRTALGQITLDLAQWRKQMPNMRSAYAFCTDPEQKGSDLRGRMFVVPPNGSGMYEDPATGSAVTGLAAYLTKRSSLKNGTLRWVMEQGFEMGRPSILEMEADMVDGECQAIRIAGSAVLVSKGTFFM